VAHHQNKNMTKDFLKVILGGVIGSLCGIISGFILCFLVVGLVSLICLILRSCVADNSFPVNFIAVLSIGFGAIIGGISGAVFSLKEIKK
jgi:hypothetical protein